MTRSARCLLIASFVCFHSICRAQQKPASSPSPSEGGSPQPSQSAETLHAGTQLVIVDVVVEDKNGRPVHGLTHDSFVLTEQKKPETIRDFEEHSAASKNKPGEPMPPMPPGVFTNYTQIAPNSTLNILLIDALNTPLRDQVYLRQQLLDYIKQEKSGTNVAIFGLTNRLTMLQGFTADPTVLRTAVEHLNYKGSPLLEDATGGGETPQKLSEALEDIPGVAAAMGEALVELKQFEAEQTSLQTQFRTNYTLDAFNSLAHYLSNFPGRKNLIWFSGSFPLQIGPDTTIRNGFTVAANSSLEFRETTDLLAKAQTAVYPIDARSLMTDPALDASQSTRNSSRVVHSSAAETLNFNQGQADEHMTMEAMANDTGGHAFYNTNGLTDAVAKAIDAGSNYYTLTYTPADRNWNGAYRNIHVELAESAAAHGMKLTYRHGYYADNPQRPAKPRELLAKAAPTSPTSAALVDHAAEAYSRAAISHGAPQPEDILFKARVLPLTGKNEDTLAPDNHADTERMKAPYRTFAVDYVALPGDFSLTSQSDGRRTGAIEVGIFVYDTEGHLLNISSKKISLNMTPDTYKQFESKPVRLQLHVSAPAKQHSFLRVVIHDIPTNHYGVVEIPSSEVGHLPPLEAQNAPADVPKPAAEATPQPTGKQ